MSHRDYAMIAAVAAMALASPWPSGAGPVLGARPASAQVSSAAVLRGLVVDSVGNAVAGAEVVLRDTADRTLGGAETDDEGRFLLLGLPPGGPYTLSVRQLGFAETTRAGLQLEAGRTRRVEITLLSRPLQLDPINVTTASDLVFSGTRTGASTVIETRMVESLPTVERDFVGFAALSPMVSIEEKRISVAGQNTRFNGLRIDGALSEDVWGLSPNGVPGGQAGARALPIDAVRQYAVLIAPYDVRHSGFTGGLLTATTRSGGERWSAAGFAYYRDEFFAGVHEASDEIRSLDPGRVEDFRSEIAGVTVGGPLPGGARLFAAAEVERRRRPTPGLNVGAADPLRTRIVPDSLGRLRQVMEERFAIGTGSVSETTLENPLGNAFARLDIPLSPIHDLTLHYNWISAAEDLAPDRFGFDAYELGSNALRLDSETHAAMARLTSRIGQHATNELILNVRRNADATRSPGAARGLPEIEVLLASEVDTAEVYGRRIQLGADPLGHANDLDQTVVQLTNNLGFAVGDHLFTVGVDGGLFGVRRRFLPASNGIWRFRSLEELERNEAFSYERLTLDEGADPDVKFGMLQVAGYAQDEWSATRDLTLTFGLRLDMPLTLSRPGYNREVEHETGAVTDRLPSGNPLFSPRIGLSWSPDGRRRTQVRGGIGVFSGRPPLAWIADAYANTGLRTSLFQCRGSFSPDPLDPQFPAPGIDLEQPPTTCRSGNIAPEPERNITFFDEDFRYPQDLRVSLAVDRELPGGFVGSVEGVYTRALHQVALEDINLALPVDDPSPDAGFTEGYGGRRYFGMPLLTGTRFGIMGPVRRFPGYGQMIRVGNRSRNAALAAAAEIQRRFSDRLDLRASYTYTRAVDVRSLLYDDAALNYGSTPIRFDPARPETGFSAFDRPHRVMGSVWSRVAEWGDGLDVTLLYVGQAGTPYSYVYETDMNGDGYPGPGAVAEAYNDLIYVPAGFSDTPLSLVSRVLMLQLATIEDCLADAKGIIMARNACRTPWSHRLDLRISQGIRTPFAGVRIVGDIMNVLNLLNDAWGKVLVAPDNVPVLNTDWRAGCPAQTCSLSSPIVGFYVGPRRRDVESGTIAAELPYIESLPESRWRAQIGIRIEF